MVMLPGPYYQGYKGRIWFTVVSFLVILLVGGLGTIGYPPARFLLHYFAPLKWAFVILFLYAVFRPRPT
jgi:hypothetical protein